MSIESGADRTSPVDEFVASVNIRSLVEPLTDDEVAFALLAHVEDGVLTQSEAEQAAITIGIVEE